ncbi:hypothetical protein ACVGVM_01600 [Pseudonocardia bannensis]|uniref:Uncharacterized protein n=1 Tax=Pseudonocardia bannensis TaxID=630973 RepID=A0A848DDN5_9PSEU|nr:hypothetical protein [Pseudonocardia bannensis]NMH90685.1 hypothetical protein [Pseudonocardia bannensis]
MSDGIDDGTDDGRLTAMFRAAASEAAAGAPAPGFDHAGVVAASRRATARRRSAVAGGVLTVLVVAGVGVAAAAPSRTSTADTSAAAGSAVAAPEAGAAPAPLSAPAPALGPGRSGPAAPLGPADPDACVNKQDPALRALLNAALPEVHDAVEAPTTMECRPGGGREVHLDVADGAATGLLSVVYSAPGAPAPEQGLPVGWVRAGAPTASGGFVSVTTRAAADSGAVPFADRVDAVVAELAPRL